MRMSSDKSGPAALAKNRRRSLLAMRVYIVVLVALVAVMLVLNRTLGLPSWIVWSVIGLQVIFLAFEVWNVAYLSVRLRRSATKRRS